MTNEMVQKLYIQAALLMLTLGRQMALQSWAMYTKLCISSSFACCVLL